MSLQTMGHLLVRLEELQRLHADAHTAEWRALFERNLEFFEGVIADVEAWYAAADLSSDLLRWQKRERQSVVQRSHVESMW